MKNLIIYKDKVVYVDYDEEKSEWVEINIDDLPMPFLFYLNSTVEFHEGVTVEDFMNFLQKHESVLDEYFVAYTGGFKFESYFNDMNKTPSEVSKLIKMKMYWSTDIYNDDGINEIEIYGGISGISDDPEDLYYSLSLSSLSEWKNLVIELDNEFIFREYNIDTKENKEILKGVKQFTLHDVISIFLDDITFYGLQDDKKEILDDLITRSNEIDTELNSVDYLKEKLKSCIDKEDYEEANVILAKIKELENE